MANEIYFNARCKVLESKLISLQNLYSLANVKSLQEAVSILNELEILKGVKVKNYKDLLQILDREENDFAEFLLRNTPNENISKFFILKYDYFNIESLFISNKLSLKEPENLIEGSIKISTIKKLLEKENYKLFSKELQNCLQYGSLLFKSSKQSGFLIDTMFKKALSEERSFYAKKNIHLSKIYSFIIDSTNIQNALRFRDYNIFNQIKLKNGTLDDAFFKSLCENDFNQILLDVKFTTYSKPIQLIINAIKANEPMRKFEFMVDCYPITYLNDYKFDANHNVPYIKYCYLKQTELINLRIIIEGLMSNRDKNIICEEIRRVYAE
jgi:vacuolar-type H+-ATPase subunit C/Vma6